MYLERGEVPRAVDVLQQSLRLKRDDATLNNLGNAYSDQGEFQKALDSYNEALKLVVAQNYRRGQVAVLTNLGHFYLDVGETHYALDYFNKALPIARQMGDPSIEASILSNIGGAHQDEGDLRTALGYFSQALQIRRAMQDKSGQAASLLNVGGVYLRLADRQKARQSYEEALAIAREIDDKVEMAGALNDLGQVYRDDADLTKASDLYKQALALVRESGDREKEAITLGNVAALELRRNNLPGARAMIEASLAITETLRTKVLDQQSRASYFAKAQERYVFYIDLLMRLNEEHPAEGYDRLALQACERGRARVLLDILDEVRANIREGVAPEMLERERSVREQLNAREVLLVKQLSRPHTAAQVAASRSEIETLLL